MTLHHDEVLTIPSASVNEDEGAPQVMQPALPPLTVSALMVTKADLITALQIYLPHLADIEAISGDRFLLMVGGEHLNSNEVTDG